LGVLLVVVTGQVGEAKFTCRSMMPLAKAVDLP
jgi:hypothetical protein